MFDPKKKRIAAVFSLTALLMTLSAGFAHENQKSEEVSASAPPPKYLVREYMGMVTVFSGMNEIIRITDSPVSTLPEDDRLMLQKGVPVNDDLKLAMLLEDYSG